MRQAVDDFQIGQEIRFRQVPPDARQLIGAVISLYKDGIHQILIAYPKQMR